MQMIMKIQLFLILTSEEGENSIFGFEKVLAARIHS